MNRAGTALTGCQVNYGLAALGSRKAISTIPCVASSNFDAPGRALVSHRRSRLLLARWHNRVPRSSRQAGQSRRISHRAGRNRKRAQPAGGVKQATVLAIGEKKNAGGIRCSSRRAFALPIIGTRHCRRRGTRLRERCPVAPSRQRSPQNR